MSLKVTPTIPSKTKSEANISIESSKINSKNVCLCVQTVNDENVTTPANMTETERNQLLQSLLPEIIRELAQSPVKVFGGKRSKDVQVKDTLTQIKTTPFLFQFPNDVNTTKPIRLKVNLNGITYCGFLINYGSNKGRFPQHTFLKEFGSTEIYSIQGNNLIKENLLDVLDPEGIRKIIADKPSKNVKTSKKVQLSKLSKQAKITQLEKEVEDLDAKIIIAETKKKRNEEIIEKLESIFEVLAACRS